MIPKLEKTARNISEQEQIAKALLAAAKKSHTLTIQPDAWISCFNITDPKEAAEYRKRVVEGLRVAECELAKKRAAEGRTVMGREKLLAQRIDLP